MKQDWCQETKETMWGRGYKEKNNNNHLLNKKEEKKKTKKEEKGEANFNSW